MRRWLLIGVAAVALFGAGTAGTVAYLHSIDPLRRADRLTESGDVRAAQVELRNAIRQNPNDADAHLRMARVQMKLADAVAAEREFRLAIARGADRAVVFPELGEAMLAQGEFKELLAIVPARGPTPALTAKDLLVRAVALLSINDTAGAQAALADARAAAPGEVGTFVIAARLAAARGDAAATEAEADSALKRDPAQIDALLLKQQLLSARGDRAGATEMAARAVKSSPFSAMARVGYAGLLMEGGQDDRAMAQVGEVLANQPRFLDAIYLRGMLLARAGKMEDASNEFTKLDPFVTRMPQVLFAQANLAAQQNRMQTAAELARRYRALAPDDYNGLLLLARTLLATERAQEARALLTTATQDGHRDAETLDLLGRALAAVGDPRGATAVLSQAVAAAPGDADILAHLGSAQFQAGNAADASDTLRRALSLSPGLATAGEALVATLLDQNQPDKAEAELDKLKASGKGNPETDAVLAALVKVRRGDLPGAEAALTEAAKAFPNSVEVKLHLSRVLAVEGRRKAAAALLKDVLAKAPGSLSVLNTYLLLLRQDRELQPMLDALDAARRARPDQPVLVAWQGDVLVAIGTPEKAVGVLQQARGAYPESIPVLASLARAQVAARNDAEAEGTWRDVLRLQPGDTTARSALFDVLVRRGDTAGARDLLTRALATYPADLGLLTSAVALESGTAGPVAGLRLADTLRQQPGTLPSSALLKGDLLMRLNRPADAASAYAAERGTVPPAILGMRLAISQARAGQDAEAAATLQSLLKDAPNNADAAQVLAQLEIRARRLPEAEAHLKTVLDQRPNDPIALNNLAWVYSETGNGQARSVAQRAYLQSPTPNAADTLGWIIMKGGDAKAAVPLLQQASDRQPDEPTFKYHLAVALRDTGQGAAASRLLQPIVAGPQPFPEKDEARKLLDALARTP